MAEQIERRARWVYSYFCLKLYFRFDGFAAADFLQWFQGETGYDSIQLEKFYFYFDPSEFEDI
jgi:hypothetical protein